jgi:anti-sigma regulatory factor (Ser/Thr protein kinase)
MNVMVPTSLVRLPAPRLPAPQLPAPRLPAPRLPAPRLHEPRLHEPPLYERRVRLSPGPAAAAEARRQVEAAICAWDVPVDRNIAILLTSELVTNAIVHEPGGSITLAVSFSYGQLWVDVFDASRRLPVVVNAAADAETGRGLMLVADLATAWGCYPTPAGKAVYFALALQPDLARGNGRDLEGT